MGNATLSIEALEAALQHARRELEKATKERLRAIEVEDQWVTELKSLESLINVRNKRLHPESAIKNGGDVAVVPANTEQRSVKETSHVDWIDRAIANSGSAGLSPPEILVAAKKAGIKMHKNYPYIVLKTLVERGRVSKQAGRYYRVV